MECARFLKPITLTIGLALCACHEEANTSEALQMPYWQAKPTLPSRPDAFCRTTTSIFRDVINADEIKCADTLAGAFGIRGKLSGSEVVIIQGAKEEWFAFAYIADDGAPLDPKILDKLVAEVEAAFMA